MAFVIAKSTSTDAEESEQQTDDINLLSDWKLWLGLTLMQVSFGVLAEIIMLFYQARFLRKNLLLILKITTNS